MAGIQGVALGSYPEERLRRESASEGDSENGNDDRFVYTLGGDSDGFKRIYNPDLSEVIFRNMNYSGLPGPPLPILVNNTESRQRDENSFLKQFEKAQSTPKKKIETKIGNCLCKSAWCPRCHSLYYVPRYKEYINKFDYRRTRHVILSTDRKKFSNELDALQTITEKKELSAFIRKLRNGKKIKAGNQWVYEHKPIKIHQAIAVLEFYRDGYPHWHLLIEVEGVGKAGMIGGENLHRAWKYGIVRETYFNNLNHWRNIAGYFADKGYFEKGKKYQTELPGFVKENINKRVRRITYYPGRREGTEEEIYPDISEEEAFKNVSEYFRKIANENEKKEEPEHEKRKTNYKIILSRCGAKTYFRTVWNQKLLEMIVPIRFELMKALIKPVYEEGKGYICEISREAIDLLELNAERVVRSRETYDQLFDEEEETEKEQLSNGGENN
ncbi:MAG: hypothetical protein JRC90_04560 [Deltaproteobacteria bacterium]|nr:hypothetical protein [Deltaproteobacteria bacterium]